ncbi:hypothetical protein ES332_D11G365100v1 [Gossypium tomentosum]|uniref:Uncharacterized protein n=1 Tax=Gossypium tomentosum TaxID=34277 RepID=A0A5D2IY04_GOSTO|nr:hypothetical protein ES332_D11G365100v1 [Gossypium tomentosum]
MYSSFSLLQQRLANPFKSQNLLLHPTLSLPTSTAVFFKPNLHRLAFGKRESARKMSGLGKKVVDVAFKASKNIDWEGMAKLLVSDEARKEFATLCRTFDEVNFTLQTKFSQIPKFVDTITPQYKPKFDALLVELKEAEEKSLKESERLEKEIAEVQELKQKISTMTADEYFEKHPELKKKFDDEIRNDYWGY